MVKRFKFSIEYAEDGTTFGTPTVKNLNWDTEMYSQLCWSYRNRIDLMMINYMSIIEKMLHEPDWEPELGHGTLVMIMNTCVISFDSVKPEGGLRAVFALQNDIDKLSFIQEGCNIDLCLDRHKGGNYYPCHIKMSIYPYIHNREVPPLMQKYLPMLSEVIQEIVRSMLSTLIPDGSDEDEPGRQRPMNSDKGI